MNFYYLTGERSRNYQTPGTRGIDCALASLLGAGGGIQGLLASHSCPFLADSILRSSDPAQATENGSHTLMGPGGGGRQREIQGCAWICLCAISADDSPALPGARWVSYLQPGLRWFTEDLLGASDTWQLFYLVLSKHSKAISWLQ